MRFARIALVVAIIRVLIPAEPALAAPSCFGKQATQVGTKDNDRIHGTPKTDVIVGLDGNDTILGVNGDDYLCGGPGNDQLTGDVGHDRIAGNEGNDYLFGGGQDDLLTGGDGRDLLEGNAGPDVLTGDAGNDRIAGNEGNDTLSGKPGADHLSGDEGADELRGDEGDDFLRGDVVSSARQAPRRWNDNLDGGAGDDTVNFWVHRLASYGMDVDLEAGTASGEGKDRLAGIEIVIAESGHRDVLRGDGDDNRFYAGSGLDRTFGMGGNDVFMVDESDDVHDGGAGIDEITFQYTYTSAVVNLLSGSALGRGSDKLVDIENATGSSGDDILAGDRGPNVLRGLSGQDNIRGGDGDDVLRGGLNAIGSPDRIDTLAGGAGDDIIDGGAPEDVDHRGNIVDGNDEVNFSSANSGVQVDLRLGQATGEGNDKLIRIEDVVGSGSDDVIVGDFGNNEINGSAGNDVIEGLHGEDELEGSPGDDSFDGGVGFDILEFNYSASSVNVDLMTGLATGQGNDTVAGIENLRGTIFDDTLLGDDNVNFITGNVGDDVIGGRGGDDDLYGHRGDDRIDGDAGIDDVFGLEGNDVMTGGEGDDRLDGNIGDDVHSGGPGNDYLLATPGNDTFQGDDGVDTLDLTRVGAAIVLDMVAGAVNHDNQVGEVDVIATIEIVYGSNHDDELIGDGADNTFLGREGLDRISGGGGNDLLGGGQGQDAIDGGEGFDLVTFEDSIRPVTVDIAQGFAEGSGSDTLVTIEGVIGSLFSDYLRGDAQTNQIFGLGGDDVIEARQGDDVLDGGFGADVGDGGDGTDECVEVEYQTACES